MQGNGGLDDLFDGAHDIDTVHYVGPMNGFDGNLDESESTDKPENHHEWGYRMTGSSSGIYRPMDQLLPPAEQPASSRHEIRHIEDSHNQGYGSRGTFVSDEEPARLNQKGTPSSPAVVINSKALFISLFIARVYELNPFQSHRRRQVTTADDVRQPGQ